MTLAGFLRVMASVLGFGVVALLSVLLYSNADELGAWAKTVQLNAHDKSLCDTGDMVACHNLGVAYSNGDGVAIDQAKAAAFYTKACEGGHSAACQNLGIAYVFGQGVAEDKEHAVNLFKRACDGGNLSGCIDLGFSYIDGVGVKIDKAKGAALFAQACDGGDAEGCFNLGVYYAKENGVAFDLEKVKSYMRRTLELDPKHQKARAFLSQWNMHPPPSPP